MQIFKKFFTFLLIISFISSAFANSFSVKLEKIYPSGNKMRISYGDGGELSSILTYSKENDVPAPIQLAKYYKIGESYTASFVNNIYGFKQEMTIYDDAGNIRHFFDEATYPKHKQAVISAIKAAQDAEAAQKAAREQAAVGETVGCILGGTLGLVLVVVLFSLAGL